MTKPSKSNEEVSYRERNRNPLNRWVNQRLDRITEDEIGKYVQRYAAHDEALAKRIRYEVTRRSQMGREIDVLEPMRWTGYSTLLGIGSGGAAKLLDDNLVKHKPVNRTALKAALIGTAIASFFGAIVMGGRILSFARFKSGLYAGAQTALALHHHAETDPLSQYSNETCPPSADKAPDWTGRVANEAKAERQL